MMSYITRLGLLFLMRAVAAAEVVKTVTTYPGQRSTTLSCPTKSVTRDNVWAYLSMYDHNAQDIYRGGILFDKFNERFSVDDRGNLFINGTKLDDAGLYTCTDKDGIGTTYYLYHIVVKDSKPISITTVAPSVDDQSPVTTENQPVTATIDSCNQTLQTISFVANGVLLVVLTSVIAYHVFWSRQICSKVCPVPVYSPNAGAETINMGDNNNDENHDATSDQTTQPLKKGRRIWRRRK